MCHNPEPKRPQAFVLSDTIGGTVLDGTLYPEGDIILTDQRNPSMRVYITKEQVEAFEGFLALQKGNVQ